MPTTRADAFRFLVESYDRRRREVAATIEEADAAADDGSAGPDALADALMEVAEGWCRSALSAAPAGARPTNCEHRGDDHGPDGCHNCACSFVPVWAVRAALPSSTPPEAAAAKAGLGEAAGRTCVECGEPWPCTAVQYGRDKKTPHRLAARLHPRPTDSGAPE